MILTVIPARGGSKRLPGKNIKMLNGLPLINYTVKEAREVFEDKNIIVSTDDQAIKQTVEATGLKVPFTRPENLATDTTSSYEVLLHAVNFFENQGTKPKILVMLQPTSPFRKAKHIREALDLYENSDVDMVVSVKETKSNPYFVLKEENNRGLLKDSKDATFTRSQDAPTVWEINGAVYVINVASLKEMPISAFKRVKKYVMDEISSLDIDDEVDWLLAEKIAIENLK